MGGDSKSIDSDDDSYGNSSENDFDSDNSSDGDDEFPWLEKVFATASDNAGGSASNTKGQIVGSCEASLIRRGQMRKAFWQNLEEPSQETSDLAFSLFDRYGRLGFKFYEHDFEKGSGVWGKELDHGDILLLDWIRVDPKWRRRGIATKLVNDILQKTKTKVADDVGFFAVVNPGVLNSEHNKAEEYDTFFKRGMPIALSFWRSVGFRRIGTSHWFAFTNNPNHPSRLLEPEQDWNPNQSREVMVPNDIKTLFAKLGDMEVKDIECLNLIMAELPNDPRDHKWHSVDEQGNTFLHIAARSFRAELIRLLLGKAPQSATTRNNWGRTALDVLRIGLECSRTRLQQCGFMMIVMSDQFRGFGNSSIACLAMLQNVDALDLSALSAEVIDAVAAGADDQVSSLPRNLIAKIRHTLRLKYGCTCGQCLGGFLSPRMKFALLCQADCQYDDLNMFVQTLDGPTWVEGNDSLMKSLPHRIRENMKTNKGMRQGFTNTCGDFAECLRRNRLPLTREINAVRESRREWPPVTHTFLDRGGSVESVANMLFKSAMDLDEWAGDGMHVDFFEGEIAKLPACRNDHEFGFVSGMCGYRRISQDGSSFIGSFTF